MNQPDLRPNLQPLGMFLTQRLEVLLPVSKRTLIIEPGIVVDGFSAPRFQYTLTGMTPFRPDLLGPSIPHDVGYGAQWPGWTKNMWDAELYALLRENGVVQKEIDETRIGLELAGELDWYMCGLDQAGIAYTRSFARLV